GLHEGSGFVDAGPRVQRGVLLELRLGLGSRLAAGEQEGEGNRCAHQPSFFRNSVLRTPGFPLPLSSFIAWPTKNPSRLVLPPLYFSTSPGLRAITASTTASSAPSSETWARPFRSTIRWGASPVRISSPRTSFAAVEEIEIPSLDAVEQLLRDSQRREIRLGEVAVVVRLLLAAHRAGHVLLVVEQPRLLSHLAAALDQLHLARDLVVDCLSDEAKGVDVLE